MENCQNGKMGKFENVRIVNCQNLRALIENVRIINCQKLKLNNFIVTVINCLHIYGPYLRSPNRKSQNLELYFAVIFDATI